MRQQFVRGHFDQHLGRRNPRNGDIGHVTRIKTGDKFIRKPRQLIQAHRARYHNICHTITKAAPPQAGIFGCFGQLCLCIYRRFDVFHRLGHVPIGFKL